MQEFMLFIKTEGDHIEGSSPEEQQAHVQKVGDYISNLMKDGKLLGAQPLQIDGKTIHGKAGVFKDGPFIESKEVIVGYFHIKAENIEEAVKIAKANPIFDTVSATVDIRPIKKLEGIN